MKHINSRWFLVTIDASGTTLSQLDVTGAAMGGYPPIPLDSNRFLILSNGETIQWTFSVYRFPDATNIWTGARTVVAGRSVTLKANLKSQVGSVPLPNQPIEFYADTRLLGSATTNAAGDANLTIVPPADLAPRVYALRAVFPGTPGQQRAEATSTLTITRESSSVWVGTRFGTIGQPVALRASLTNRTTNLPMAGESLRFSVGAVVLGDAVTGVDGFADLNVVLPDTLNSGAQTLTVTYAGSASVSGSTGTATLTITKATPSLWVGNRSGTIGSSVTLDAILTRSGNPVVGRTVEFRVGGNLLASGVTDSTGRASVPTILPDWLTAGSLTLTASFAGDGAYNAVSRTGTLTVSKANTSMWVGSRSGKANAPVQYRAYLKSGTAFVVGRTLVLKANGVQVGTGVTDATGYITINTTIPNLVPGTYPLTASFAGDGAYNASSASGTLTVTP
ncbi:MAG: Ig-like domain repeat protein [Fimbriimonas sp.]